MLFKNQAISILMRRAQPVQAVATGWTTEVSIPSRVEIYSLPQRPDRFWGPPDLSSRSKIPSSGITGLSREVNPFTPN